MRARYNLTNFTPDFEQNLANFKEDCITICNSELSEDEALLVANLALRGTTIENGVKMTFWGVSDWEGMPADCRIHYVYIPTYYMVGLLTNLYVRFASIRNIDFIKKYLYTGLYGAMGRNFLGHNYERESGFIEAMEIFDVTHIADFVEQYPDFNSDFTTRYLAAFDYRRKLCEKMLCSSSKQYVWYAAYGSNMLRDRFRCYIEGGSFEGSSYREGCTDKTLWKEEKAFYTKGEVYFANSSPSWGGKGVAFFDPNGKSKVLMHLYMITTEQIKEVWKQEENNDNWYNSLMNLGTTEGIPVYTITSKKRKCENKPSEHYLDVINRGISETKLI